MEIPVEQPSRVFAPAIKRRRRHALQLETVLFSIYYPTTTCLASSSSSSSSKTDQDHKKDSTATTVIQETGPDSSNEEEDNEGEASPPFASRLGVPWLSRPRVRTCHGYAKWMGAPRGLVTAYMASTCMWTKLPAFRNAKLAKTRPLSSSPDKGEHGEEAKTNGQDKLGKFPVIVFSHGLGGTRTLYSTVCGDLASYGFVVVALEHRDGSGARTYVNRPPETREANGLGTLVSKIGRKNGRSGRRTEKGKRNRGRHYHVDYLFPKDNPQDTVPRNEKGVDLELREAQIEMRISEIEEAFKILQIINVGDPENMIKRWNLRKKPNRGSSSKGLDGVDWADWKGRLWLENVTAMGHSFGGATTVQILRLNDRFPWVGQGVLLDAWGPGAPEVPPGSEQTITKPLLSIGSEPFMHWEDNYKKMAEICAEARQGSEGLCWMLTVRGSTHLSQTDFALLYPRFMSLVIKTLIDPQRGIYLTVALSLEFLKLVLPPTQTATYDTSGWADEGLLRGRSRPDRRVTHDHKADEKWTAARLKVDNELKLRTKAWWNSQSWKGRRQGSVPEDKPEYQECSQLCGLGPLRPGQEIWVHMCPTKAGAERHLGGEAESGHDAVSGVGGDVLSAKTWSWPR